MKISGNSSNPQPETSNFFMKWIFFRLCEQKVRQGNVHFTQDKEIEILLCSNSDNNLKADTLECVTLANTCDDITKTHSQMRQHCYHK